MQCAPCRSRTLLAATSSLPCRGYQYQKVTATKKECIKFLQCYLPRPRVYYGVLDILTTEFGGTEACAGADQRGKKVTNKNNI